MKGKKERNKLNPCSAVFTLECASVLSVLFSFQSFTSVFFQASSANSAFITQTTKLAFLATAIKAAKTLRKSLWLPWFLSIFFWLFLRIVFPPMGQGGGEREKCRPLAHTGQIPFIHLALFLIYAKCLYIFKSGSFISSIWFVDLSHDVVYNCHLHMRSCKTTANMTSLCYVKGHTGGNPRP